MNQRLLLLKGCTVIRKFSLKIFDPQNFQAVDFLYAPSFVQIEVGDTVSGYSTNGNDGDDDGEDKTIYTYKSKIFKVNN